MGESGGSHRGPADVAACSRTCKRLRELGNEEGKAWLPMCERRWGSVTDLSSWGNGRIPRRLLYGILARWEHLIGFWRGVGNCGCGFLALFEWAPQCIVGHKAVPASLDTYSVRKIPFLWMSVSKGGQMTCFLDSAVKNLKTSDGRPLSATSPSDSTSSTPFNFGHMNPKNRGMLSVGVHFVGNHHLVIEEIAQRSGCASNKLAEAATLAAFGSSHIPADVNPAARGIASSSNVASPYSSSSEIESCIGSPPGSFQHGMYQFLVSKVANSGGDRAARKQKRKDKELAWSWGKCVLEPEHSVKVVHASPTKARPLQGLWKGLFDTVGLDFLLVSYDDMGRIVCRKVQYLAGTSQSGSVLWTSESASRVVMPADKALYSSRLHTQPFQQTSTLGEGRDVAFSFIQ